MPERIKKCLIGAIYKDILEKKQSIILDESECNEEYNVLLSCNLNELLKDFDNEFEKDIALQK